MRVKTWVFNLGWLEIWVQLRLGRASDQPLRRYRPGGRHQTEKAGAELRKSLAALFDSDQLP